MDLEHQGTDPWDREVVFSESEAPSFFAELRLTGFLRGLFRVAPQREGVWSVQGDIEGTQILTCSRTLEPFHHPVRVSLSVEVQGSAVSEGQELDDEDEELFRIRIPVARKVVDLSECVRQLVVLQEPMSPVKDPHVEFHWVDPDLSSDEEKPVDPRWEKLKQWKSGRSFPA